MQKCHYLLSSLAKLCMALLAFLCIFSSCTPEEEWIQTTRYQPSFTPLEEFQENYQHIYEANPGLRGFATNTSESRVDLGLIDPKPMWDKAQVSLLGDTVRMTYIPVLASLAGVEIHETLDSLTATKYADKLFRIALVRKEYKDKPKKTQVYYLHYQPSREWLEQGGEYPEALNQVPEHFDGIIKAYTLSGSEVFRYILRDGSIIRRYRVNVETARSFFGISPPQDYINQNCSKFLKGYVYYTHSVEVNLLTGEHINRDDLADYQLFPKEVRELIVTGGHYKVYELVCREQSLMPISFDFGLPENSGDMGLYSIDPVGMPEDLQFSLYNQSGMGGGASGITYEVDSLILPNAVIKDYFPGGIVNNGAKKEDIDRVLSIYVKAKDTHPLGKALHDELTVNKRGFESIQVIRNDNVPQNASVDRMTRVFRVYHPDYIDKFTIVHELIHLYQIEVHSIGKEQLKEVNGMMEYEVRLILDIVEYIQQNRDKKPADFEHYWMFNSLTHKTFSRLYKDWLKKITQDGTRYPTEIDESEYRKWAIHFGDTSSAYHVDKGHRYDSGVNYPPKALLDIFKLIRL